ncbi:MAG TPA: hypothetical protein VNV61_07945 [Steroidobacteraceae bacterium]|jgi:hypothetical protein|nr:hypothetical protein [Steroidobacteraceae bacterium]
MKVLIGIAVSLVLAAPAVQAQVEEPNPYFTGTITGWTGNPGNLSQFASETGVPTIGGELQISFAGGPQLGFQGTTLGAWTVYANSIESVESGVNCNYCIWGPDDGSLAFNKKTGAYVAEGGGFKIVVPPGGENQGWATRGFMELIVGTVDVFASLTSGWTDEPIGHGGGRGGGAFSVPELDMESAYTALTLLFGGMLVIRGRRQAARAAL